MRKEMTEEVVVRFVSRYKMEDNKTAVREIEEILLSNNTLFKPSLNERIEFEGTLEEKVKHRVKERLSKYHYIIAELNGKIIGFTEVCFDDSMIHNEFYYCGCVGTSAVHIDYQGFGIAKMLYKKLDEIAIEFEVEAVVRSTWTMNSRQLKLYSEFEYSEIERNENFRGKGNHLVKYCKWFK